MGLQSLRDDLSIEGPRDLVSNSVRSDLRSCKRLSAGDKVTPKGVKYHRRAGSYRQVIPYGISC